MLRIELESVQLREAESDLNYLISDAGIPPERAGPPPISDNLSCLGWNDLPAHKPVLDGE